MLKLPRLILVFWLFFETFVSIIAFLLIIIVLNISKILFVFVFYNSYGINIGSKCILVLILALITGSFLAKTTVLVFFN